ncbi:hypothetical protein [Streptococcus oralis]
MRSKGEFYLWVAKFPAPREVDRFLYLIDRFNNEFFNQPFPAPLEVDR